MVHVHVRAGVGGLIVLTWKAGRGRGKPGGKDEACAELHFVPAREKCGASFWHPEGRDGVYITSGWLHVHGMG